MKKKQSEEIKIGKESLFEKLRLWRIENALGVRLSKWQREYVFAAGWEMPPQSEGRATGKTLAVNVKILMFYKGRYFAGKKYGSINPLQFDPDYHKNKAWHAGNLKGQWKACKAHRIRVFEFSKRTNEFF